MGDVNSERARREAAETVGNQRPSTGENRVQAAMRRYLGAEIFDELQPEPSTEAARKAKPAAVAPEQGTEGPGEGESKSS
jgi:hypothetical protein